MKYLGLDLGSRTLGVAISDVTHTIATSYIVIRHNEEYDRLLDDVEKIVKDEHIEKIVLGFPKNMNNTIGPKGELSLEFKKKLEQKLNIEVILQDERLTTKEAESVLIKNNTRRNKRRKVIDKLAATIILQSYLDKEKNLWKKNSFTLIDENGNEVEYDVLFTFESEETNKNYIVYTDQTKDDAGNIQVYASIYDPNDPNSKLEPINTDKEWKVIETILSTLQEEIKKKQESNE